MAHKCLEAGEEMATTVLEIVVSNTEARVLPGFYFKQ